MIAGLVVSGDRRGIIFLSAQSLGTAQKGFGIVLVDFDCFAERGNRGVVFFGFKLLQRLLCRRLSASGRRVSCACAVQTEDSQAMRYRQRSGFAVNALMRSLPQFDGGELLFNKVRIDQAPRTCAQSRTEMAALDTEQERPSLSYHGPVRSHGENESSATGNFAVTFVRVSAAVPIGADTPIAGPVRIAHVLPTLCEFYARSEKSGQSLASDFRRRLIVFFARNGPAAVIRGSAIVFDREFVGIVTREIAIDGPLEFAQFVDMHHVVRGRADGLERPLRRRLFAHLGFLGDFFV